MSDWLQKLLEHDDNAWNNTLAISYQKYLDSSSLILFRYYSDFNIN